MKKETRYMIHAIVGFFLCLVFIVLFLYAVVLSSTLSFVSFAGIVISFIYTMYYIIKAM